MKNFLMCVLVLTVFISVGFAPLPAAGLSITFPVSYDVSLASNSYDADVNHESVTHPYLWVGNNENDLNKKPRDYETMFGFQIPPLVGSGEELILNSASISAYVNFVQYEGPVRIAEGNTDDWDPFQVTWNNSHDNFGAELDSVYLGSGSLGTWTSWDISGAGAGTFADGFFTAYLYNNLADGLCWHDFENLECGRGHVAYLSLDYDVVPGGAAPVPEPSTMFLMGVGLLGLVGMAKRKKRK